MDIARKSLLRDLILATERNDFEHVKKLLDLGLEADEVDEISHQTALFSAACNGHVELTKFLLSKVRHPDSSEFGGATPLAYVIHGLGERPSGEKQDRLMSIIHLLLGAGANPNAGSDKHQTPLVLSRAYKMTDIETILDG
ncbi:MAG: ankyrin repeat domain-containing protein [Gemmatales bacterium]